MKNPIKLISLVILAPLIFACDNVPTTEQMLADPVLRKEIEKKCLLHSNARWDEKHEHHSLCSNLVGAVSACMRGRLGDDGKPLCIKK